MVDCRPGAGAPPHELTHTQPNGGAPPDNHHNQAGGSGDMGAHGIASPASVRASTPATTNTLTTYTTDAMNPGGGYAVGGGACAPYVCGVKGVVWCGGAGGAPLPPAPHLAPPPPPPHGVNPHVFKSLQANGADLPMNDIPTLRYYFNLGVECMWAAYGPPPPHPPPRHYSPRDLAQDMQQISLHDRPLMNHNSGADQNQKHKPGPPSDKPQLNNQGKGNGQRPLLGPRFKRGGGNQDGNQNSNHNQNKHNNNMGNKGPNNRRNSHGEGRGAHGGYSAGEGECVMEQPLLTLPYIPYPPPMYPIQYYPVETDPAMMGMMGGMGYVGYEEGVFEGGMAPYYPHAPHYPPPHHPHHPAHPHHLDHK